jgi:hypothetical protein
MNDISPHAWYWTKRNLEKDVLTEENLMTSVLNYKKGKKKSLRLWFLSVGW